MAGIFKTLGSTLEAVDTLASSGSRRLAVWATEQEAQTKYRHVAAMVRIKTEAAHELASQTKKLEAALQDSHVAQAMAALEALDKQEAKND